MTMRALCVICVELAAPSVELANVREGVGYAVLLHCTDERRVLVVEFGHAPSRQGSRYLLPTAHPAFPAFTANFLVPGPKQIVYRYATPTLHLKRARLEKGGKREIKIKHDPEESICFLRGLACSWETDCTRGTIKRFTAPQCVLGYYLLRSSRRQSSPRRAGDCCRLCSRRFRTPLKSHRRHCSFGGVC